MWTNFAQIIQIENHGRCLENLFCASSAELKDQSQTNLKLVKKYRGDLLTKTAKIVPTEYPRRVCTESLGNSHPLANRDRSEFLLTDRLNRLINKIDKLIATVSHPDMHSMHYPPKTIYPFPPFFTSW